MTDQWPDEWGPHFAEMMRDPECRAMYEAASADRPRVEFHRSTYWLVIAAAGLGLILAVGVVW